MKRAEGGGDHKGTQTGGTAFALQISQTSQCHGNCSRYIQDICSVRPQSPEEALWLWARVCVCVCVCVCDMLASTRPLCIMHLLLFFLYCTWCPNNKSLGRALYYFFFLSFTNQSHLWCPHKPHSLDSCPLMGITINYIRSTNVHSSYYSSRDLVIARQLASCLWRNSPLPLGKISQTTWERLFPE